MASAPTAQSYTKQQAQIYQAEQERARKLAARASRRNLNQQNSASDLAEGSDLLRRARSSARNLLKHSGSSMRSEASEASGPPTEQDRPSAATDVAAPAQAGKRESEPQAEARGTPPPGTLLAGVTSASPRSQGAHHQVPAAAPAVTPAPAMAPGTPVGHSTSTEQFMEPSSTFEHGEQRCSALLSDRTTTRGPPKARGGIVGEYKPATEAPAASATNAGESGVGGEAHFKFAVGARVQHAQRGAGTVTEHMEDGRTRIAFDSGEEHRYAERSMHKVEAAPAPGAVPDESLKDTVFEC